MKTSNDNTCTTAELLYRIRMSDSQRLEARVALARGERIANALLAAVALFRTAKSGAELPALVRRKSYN